MTAQERLSSEHSSFDNMNEWLHGGFGLNTAKVEGLTSLVDDIRTLNVRLERLQKMGSYFERVELSPYASNVAKMVGTMEVMLSDSDDDKAK
ncbi:MAG: hypothetical protein JXR97_05670 [Planctomycetes bacterium]|nr:hypothetical protein [Planctomycetota bacterium]